MNGPDTKSPVQTERPKHLIKPPNYDRTSLFETFLVRFQNCSAYNRWTEDEQLVHLQNSLEKEAGQRLVFLHCCSFGLASEGKLSDEFSWMEDFVQ